MIIERFFHSLLSTVFNYFSSHPFTSQKNYSILHNIRRIVDARVSSNEQLLNLFFLDLQLWCLSWTTVSVLSWRRWPIRTYCPTRSWYSCRTTARLPSPRRTSTGAATTLYEASSRPSSKGASEAPLSYTARCWCSRGGCPRTSCTSPTGYPPFTAPPEAISDSWIPIWTE